MLTKAWIALLMGLLLGSLFFSSGCGWWNGYSNNAYDYGAPCNCGVSHGTVPAAATGGTPGWHAPTASGAAVGGAAVGVSTATTP